MVSVGDILALPTLSLEAIVTARTDAEVRWVATSELADPAPFLEGGEILLTTGLVQRDAGGWETLVSSLVEAGVVALGFGVGLSHPDVPAELGEAARASALTLFVVPRPIPFIAVSRAVADLLWASERDADRQALLHQQTLTNAALSPGGTTDLLSALAAIVGGDTIVAAPDGTVLVAAGGLAAATELASRALPHIERIHAVGIRGAATEITRSSRMTVHPVGLGTHAEAYLVVESRLATTAVQRTVITMAVALLTLDRERARAELDADRRIRAGALSLTLQGDLAAARSLLAGTAQSATLPGARAQVIRASGSDAALDRALTQLERDPEPLDHPLVARVASTEAGGGDQLVAIIQPGEERQERLILALTPLTVGVGPARPLSAIAHSDAAARRALATASAVRPVVAWSELAEDGVDSLLDADALEAYAENLLDAVLTRPDATEILDSLHAFLANNGHVGPAADSLGMHRNTLRNRLTTAEELLGRSMHDPQFRSDLWIALKQLRDQPRRLSS